MARLPRPKKGCFVSTYPQTTWREVECVAASQRPFLPKNDQSVRLETVGDALDYSSQITGAALVAEGSFDSVSATGENYSGSANVYSLQLNTNYFVTTACSGGQNGCVGWEQFIFLNLPAGTSTAFIEYWLIGYGSACPSGWQAYAGGDCFINSDNIIVPGQAITTLEDQTLTGVAASGSTNDSLTLSIGNQLYSVTGSDYFPDLGQHWNATEFNVFGPGGGGEAVFDTGSTIVVRTAMDSGTAAPSCVTEGFTAETNSLTLVATPIAESGAQWPSIVFTESNAGNPSSASCSTTGVAPVSATATAISGGQPTTLTVAPTGSGPFTYQWYMSASGDPGTAIPGATSAGLTVSPGVTTSYWVQITGPGGLVQYGQTTLITVAPSLESAPATDGPLPLWTVGALGAALFGLGRRAMLSHRPGSR